MVNKKAEEYKGRAKEAAGEVTDDEELKREGRLEQGSARVKKKVEDTTDKVKDALSEDDKDR